jgi:hypothetical protein
LTSAYRPVVHSVPVEKLRCSSCSCGVRGAVDQAPRTVAGGGPARGEGGASPGPTSWVAPRSTPEAPPGPGRLFDSGSEGPTLLVCWPRREHLFCVSLGASSKERWLFRRFYCLTDSLDIERILWEELSSAVRLDPCQAGGALGDDLSDRRGDARISGCGRHSCSRRPFDSDECRRAGGGFDQGDGDRVVVDPVLAS